MIDCVHAEIDVSVQWHDDMHCEGWRCRACAAYIHGECHHLSWCRADFCGTETPAPDPVPGSALA